MIFGKDRPEMASRMASAKTITRTHEEPMPAGYRRGLSDFQCGLA